MRTVLITGGSRGIGAQAVRHFSIHGYRVAFFYHQSKEQAQKLSGDTGAVAIACDLRDSASVNKAVKEALWALSRIDAVIHSAGIAASSLLTDVSDEDWNDILTTNLTSAFYLSRAIIPHMVSRKHGRIVTLSSVWGQMGASCEVAYSASKAGIIGFTKALSKELAPSAITVNCVCPGVIDTDMMACYDEQTKQQLTNETPIGRLGTPLDIAHCLLYLCSAEADFITGQVIGIGGGFGM